MTAPLAAPSRATPLSTATGGATLWFTGLPSAGKTTIARAVAERLTESGNAVELLDGDETRAALSPELGFSREDRARQVSRIGWVAHRLARNGVIVLAPLVSPYAADRNAVRASHTDALFLEIYVAAPVEVCAERDVKGLYAKAFRGEIIGMTGVDDPYETPVAPDLVIASGEEPLETSVNSVLALLLSRFAR